MFSETISFNQDIGNWDVSNGKDFVSTPINSNTACHELTHIPHEV